MGIPVSIAKYKDGKIVSSVYMVARSQEQIIENSRKALDFIGGIRVKVKENAFTKSSTWNLDKYEYLGGGYYYDGTDVWFDFDGDGMGNPNERNDGGGSSDDGGNSSSSGSSNVINENIVYTNNIDAYIDMIRKE